MNLSSQDNWEALYKSGRHLSTWPWSDLVSLFMRFVRPHENQSISVLELGVGAGANISFFKSLPNVSYFGLDYSQTSIDILSTKHPDLKEKLRVGDFTSIRSHLTQCFDVVVDRASLTHNIPPNISKALESVTEALNPGGIFIGVDWFSQKDDDFRNPDAGYGTPFKDSKENFSDGQFAGVGIVTFSDERCLREYFKEYEILWLEEKLFKLAQGNGKQVRASWNIVARKNQKT